MTAYKLESAGDSGVLYLSGELGIENAAELRQAFIDAIDKCPELAVDLSEVESCHIAVLQILLSAQATLEAKGSQLGCQGEIPETVMEASKEAGLLLGIKDSCFWRRG